MPAQTTQEEQSRIHASLRNLIRSKSYQAQPESARLEMIIVKINNMKPRPGLVNRQDLSNVIQKYGYSLDVKDPEGALKIKKADIRPITTKVTDPALDPTQHEMELKQVPSKAELEEVSHRRRSAMGAEDIHSYKARRVRKEEAHLKDFRQKMAITRVNQKKFIEAQKLERQEEQKRHASHAYEMKAEQRARIHADELEIARMEEEQLADVEIKDDEYVIPIDPEVDPEVDPLGDEPDIPQNVIISNEELLAGIDQGDEHKHDVTGADDQAIRYAKEGDFKEDPDFTGGNGDLLSEIDLNYRNRLVDGEYDPFIDPAGVGERYDDIEDVYGHSGLPRTERKFNSQIAQDLAPHSREGGAGESVEEIALRDYIRTQLIDTPSEEKYGELVDMSMQTEEFGDFDGGLAKTDLERQMQSARRKGGKMPRLFPTKTIRQSQPEEGAPQRNRRNRYDQVALIRSSALNHMRSVTELMPTA